VMFEDDRAMSDQRVRAGELPKRRGRRRRVATGAAASPSAKGA
jgi:hypothetical protein